MTHRMEPSKKLDAAGTLPANPPLKLHPDRGAGPAVLVPEQGGYKERFVKAVEDKYKCEKCRLVLCNPKQTECGHRFCETCMGALLSSSSPKCTACREGISKDKKHEDTECPCVVVSCPHKCSVQTLLRSELSAHLSECVNAPSTCSFKRYGCVFQGTNQQIKAHEASSAVQHVNLLKEWSNSLEKKVSLLQNESVEKNKSIQSLHNQICSFEIEIERQKEMLRNNESKILHLQMWKRVIDSQAEKLKELDKEIRPFRQSWEEAGSMKSSVESLQSRVTELESVDKSAGQAARNTGLLESQLSRHDQMLSVHDIRLADMDLRFQVLETASYNGVLIWKIRDYKRRKQEAVMGKTLSLYSQPFYTGYFGYKMCARVYLNGDGMGKGTHLSLFFVIMRGEYDALLPWPFKQKVTLMLMDQGSSRRHLGDAFKPDPNSSSFKKPTGEMNIASGCPVFVAQTVLENGTYIKDDTIFIKVIVDTSDLPDP
uniref:TNF receptor-associated factor n=1 Tax=Tursiops truncatus TaxID=9739 RepID=A0A2U4CQ84_TURTR|nr:TNF receptor-associated factor 3 isoform X8 [Tursiops truncatus]XP_030739172.1 TNF receptor-associated factor 3 isoform X8 [Globicephala melas]